MILVDLSSDSEPETLCKYHKLVLSLKIILDKLTEYIFVER
jgi:hypothetical protein